MSGKHYYTDEKNAQVGIVMRKESIMEVAAHRPAGIWYNMRRKRDETI